MSHATYEWVMSHENESCHTHDTVMSRINELWHRQLSHVTHARVMSNINESRHTYERVKSSLHESWSKAPLHHTLQTHTRISHVTHDWVMKHWSHWHIDDTLYNLQAKLYWWSKAPVHHTLQTHTRISHVIYDWVMSKRNESWHTYECVQLTSLDFWWSKAPVHRTLQTHTWMSHVTYDWAMSNINESWHMSMCTTYKPRLLMVKGSSASHFADSHMNEPHHIWSSHGKCKWVITHIYHIWSGIIGQKWVTWYISMCTTYRPRLLIVESSSASHFAERAGSPSLSWSKIFVRHPCWRTYKQNVNK